jgi:hypothetical protein
MQSSVSLKGPVRVGATPNIAQSMAHFQSMSTTPVRLLHYVVIENEAERLACERAFRDLFVSFNIKTNWYKFEIMQHCRARPTPSTPTPEPKSAIARMLDTYGITLTSNTSRDPKR